MAFRDYPKDFPADLLPVIMGDVTGKVDVKESVHGLYDLIGWVLGKWDVHPASQGHTIDATKLQEAIKNFITKLNGTP